MPLISGWLIGGQEMSQLALASPAHEEYLCTRKRLVPHVLRDDTMIRQQVEVYQTETMVYLLRENEHTACLSRERSKITCVGEKTVRKLVAGRRQTRSERCDAISELLLDRPNKRYGPT